MMPRGQLVHSGVRKMDFFEDPNHDGWEINRDNNRLVFIRLTSCTTEYEYVNNAPPGQVRANPIVNVNVPHQELLISQNEVQIDQAEMVAENEAEMNFSFEEEEDPEEDPNSYWEEGEFRPNDH
ncbi:hypothetical protein P8452_52595 [Trifolium repens]|nr:hypothetical protein P8452_52595 [Trifolium repens]